MLQVAAHPLRELRQVKNTALLLKQTNGGKDLTYDEYVQLLSYAASDFDNGQTPVKNKCQIDEFSDPKPFDIDTPVETIQAYASNYRTNPRSTSNDTRVRMPKER
jgi:hypothetical protein